MISHEVKYFADSEKRSEKQILQHSTMALGTGEFNFKEHMEKYDLENSAIHRKLQSKVEALQIMRSELEKYRSERDQFKLMAETLQMRYAAMKNSLNSPELRAVAFGHSSAVSLIVNQTREKNMSLSTEVEALRQRVFELEGDIKALRTQNSDLQVSCNILRSTEELKLKMNGKVVWQAEKSKLISQMEKLKKKNAQLQYDFRSLLDEKEDLVTERDAYKCKAHRLNHELGVVLKGDKSQATILDVDGLILENKYQQEKIANLENELELAKQSAAKYKNMLDTKRRKGIIKLGSNNNETIMSHSQVKALLERGTVEELPLKAATISEMKSLCLALLDNVNDKSLALSHQKKTNKLLAAKIAELEQRIHALSGSNGTTLSCLSPSQILLNGYTSATVDQDLVDDIKQLKASSRSECSYSGGGREASGLRAYDREATSSNTSQGLPTELLSSESNKSLPSCSELGDRDFSNGSSSDFTSNAEETDGIQLDPYIHADRKLSLGGSELPELTPEIAELVRHLSKSWTDDASSAN
ncbi:coiled-coil domain-containing protein 149-like [Topomyia yanbarensis]|uniref:coiled-coil domain-containing protein 149-like n=1 Tax=Topomyia yanbarensis TaxID=2498891 RepID=UPI00273BD98B|nr:coiled-coil domain-containing protein 149-like [Topomyia yanbarensis]XP_058840677.1 coiled-coil domain-containing protein 149-like [Topomyia yanbarensis]